jgi:hypothetical protein
MITLAQLTGVHCHTYQKIFCQPTSTDVRRSAVRSLLNALGHVVVDTKAGLKVTRNGHVLVSRSLTTGEVETENQLIELQHFLKRSENPLQLSNGREAHLLLIIGHHTARLFRSDIYGGSQHQLLPHDEPNGSAGSGSVGERTAIGTESWDEGDFFGRIAQALHRPGRILIFGESSTSQEEMDHFIAGLKWQHPDLANRIVGSLVLEKDQANSAELLAKAQAYHACTSPMSAAPNTPDSIAKYNRHNSAKISPNESLVSTTPSDDAIRDYAFHLYEQSGHAPGHDLNNWLKATAHLNSIIPSPHSLNRTLDCVAGIACATAPASTDKTTPA